MVGVDLYVKVIPAVMMLCHGLNKRDRYALRFLIIIPACLLMSWMISCVYFLVNETIISRLPVYIFLLASIYAIEVFLYQSSTLTLLFNLLGGYAINQIFLMIFHLLSYAIPFLSQLSIRGFPYYMWQNMWFIVSYFCVNLLYIRHHPLVSLDKKDRLPSLYIAFAMSLFIIYFNLVRSLAVERASEVDIACIICILLFYVMVLLLRSGVLERLNVERELYLSRRVWEEKEKSLRLTTEAINLINIKYHDLRHLLPQLENQSLAKQVVEEISHSMDDYANAFSTGNNTLDMILTEQLMKAQQSKVDLTAIADGNALSFLSALDIISLFSNALDNAREAVINLPLGKRSVNLTVKHAAGQVAICIENPYSAKLNMQGGIPLTTKSDKNYHGFGMKSIRQVVEKYGGSLTVNAENDLFRLMILLPQK